MEPGNRSGKKEMKRKMVFQLTKVVDVLRADE